MRYYGGWQYRPTFMNVGYRCFTEFVSGIRLLKHREDRLTITNEINATD